MAVKVVYDSKRGLVQENDATGAGGFEIKDAFLSQGVEGPSAAAPVAGDALELASAGVSVVTTGAGQSHVSVPDPDAGNVGQMKTVILKTDGGGDCLVKANGGNTLATLDDAGDVAVLIWDGADWRLVLQTA